MTSLTDQLSAQQDRELRAIALAHAVDAWRNHGPDDGPTDIVGTAQAFYAFLSGVAQRDETPSLAEMLMALEAGRAQVDALVKCLEFWTKRTEDAL
jgi:hypothetical protein